MSIDLNDPKALDAYMRVLRIFLGDQYEKLKSIPYKELPEEDKKTLHFLNLTIFRDQYDDPIKKLMEQSGKEKEENEYYRRSFKHAIAIRESQSEPIFTLNLPDDCISKLINAGVSTIGDLVFNFLHDKTFYLNGVRGIISYEHTTEEEIKGLVKLKPLRKLIEIPLHNVVGEEMLQIIGSRLIQFKYMSREQVLAAIERSKGKNQYLR